MKRYILVFTCIFLFVFNIMAQIKNIGSYHVNNYSEIDNELLATTNAIVQDSNGIMMFANNKGIAIFDGIHWELIKLPNNSSVYSLATGENGIIYVGAMDEFGYLKPEVHGKMQYVSLIPDLPDEYKGTGNITNIYTLPQGVLFVSNNQLIIFKNGKCKVIQPVSPTSGAIQVNNKIIVSVNHAVFKLFENGKLQEMPGLSELNCENTLAFIQWQNKSLLAIDNEKGCYEYVNNKFKLVNTAFTTFALKNKITTSLTLKNGYTVLGSMHSGAIIIDLNGNIVQHISKSNGLENNKIVALYEDVCGNLWIGHDIGVSYVQISSPFTYLEVQGQGGGYSAKIFNNKLYLGTSQGLFQMPWSYKNSYPVSNTPVPVEGISGQTWTLSEINNTLYACNSHGTFIIKNTSSLKIDSRAGTWAFMPLPNHQGYYIQGTYSGFNLFYLNGNELQFKHQLTGFYKSCRVFEYDHSGYIWITHGYDGVYRLKVNTDLKSISYLKFYGKDKGFPSNLGINVYKLKNKLLFTSEHGGIYEYSSSNDSFILYTGLEKYIGKYPKLSKLFEDGSGNITFIELDRSGVLINKGNGIYEVFEHPFAGLSKKQIRGFELIFPIDSNSYILGTTNGFLHYSTNIDKKYNIPYNALIRKVEIIKEKDSLIFYGYRLNDSKIKSYNNIIPHKYNSLRFGFAAPFFENSEKIKYSCYLEGFEKNWSEWSPKFEREYTNLAGGKYVFHVKAINIYNLESKEDTYFFYVKPPFTFTWWAYGIYFILFLLLIKGLVTLYSRKKVAKYRRESLVKEREIVNLKNQQLHSEIEFKNKELGSMTMQMIKRNEILLNIKYKLEEIYENLPSTVKNSVYLILKAIENDVNAEKDWEFLQVNFDSVYIGFLKKLKELFPELKSTELQLCAYIRMGLSNKEIAVLMNSTVRGVEGYRYRLRKNLNIEHDENIKDFLFNLIQ